MRLPQRTPHSRRVREVHQTMEPSAFNLHVQPIPKHLHTSLSPHPAYPAPLQQRLGWASSCLCHALATQPPLLCWGPPAPPLCQRPPVVCRRIPTTRGKIQCIVPQGFTGDQTCPTSRLCKIRCPILHAVLLLLHLALDRPWCGDRSDRGSSTGALRRHCRGRRHLLGGALCCRAFCGHGNSMKGNLGTEFLPLQQACA